MQSKFGFTKLIQAELVKNEPDDFEESVVLIMDRP